MPSDVVCGRNSNGVIHDYASVASPVRLSPITLTRRELFLVPLFRGAHPQSAPQAQKSPPVGRAIASHRDPLNARTSLPLASELLECANLHVGVVAIGTQLIVHHLGPVAHRLREDVVHGARVPDRLLKIGVDSNLRGSIPGVDDRRRQRRHDPAEIFIVHRRYAAPIQRHRLPAGGLRRCTV